MSYCSFLRGLCSARWPSRRVDKQSGGSAPKLTGETSLVEDYEGLEYTEIVSQNDGISTLATSKTLAAVEDSQGLRSQNGWLPYPV